MYHEKLFSTNYLFFEIDVHGMFESPETPGTPPVAPNYTRLNKERVPLFCPHFHMESDKEIHYQWPSWII
ncbi:MAG: hypothetical protein RIC35_23870 [Marinoscillum sp.]